MASMITDAVQHEVLETSRSDEQAILIDKAAHSVKWAILYNLLPRFITPVSTLILGALLTPNDFGLVAISTFVVALARIVIDPGLGKALIQQELEDVNEAASLTLEVNLLTSLLLYVGLWLSAPSIAHAYNNTEITSVIRVAALALPLTALTTTPKSLLRRKMEFSRLFWIYSSFLILSAVASVILAAYGAGAWAIIWGQLLGLILSVILSWRLVRWRPQIVVRWSVLRPMLGFSVWVMIWGFQEWMFSYADNAIAGLFLGVQALGIYSLGFNMATLLPAFLIAGLSDVAYSAFCRMQDNPTEVGTSLLQVQKLSSAVLFPVAFGMAAVAPVFVNLLYGEKWPGLGMVISLLVIMPGLSALWSLNAMAYQAIGKPDVSAKISGISLLGLLPLLWISAPYGLSTFTWVRFGAAWLLPIGNLLIAARVLGISIRRQASALTYTLLLSVIMCAVVSMMAFFLHPFTGLAGWLKFVSLIVGGGMIYLILLRIVDAELWGQMITSIRRMIS